MFSEPLFTDYDVLVAVLREVPREHLEKLQLGCKQWTCMVERWENILPKRRIENMVICVSCTGPEKVGSEVFSVVADTDQFPSD